MPITFHGKSHRPPTVQPRVPLDLALFEEIQKRFESASAHQDKCESDAVEFLRFYWGKDAKQPCTELEKLTEWLGKNQPLDRWFFIYLIEAAGQEALKRGVSQIASDNAKSKNARARAWVLSEWLNRDDQGQSKASFARQYAALVKTKFRDTDKGKDQTVTPETIARDWLPKTKK